MVAPSRTHGLRQIAQNSYRICVIALGFILLIATTLAASHTLVVWATGLTALFVGLHVFFPINLLFNRIDLIQVTTLGAGVLYGAPTAGWGAVLGLVGGYIFQGIRGFEKSEVQADSERREAMLEAGFSIGAHTFALQLTLVSTGFIQGLAGIGPVESMGAAVLRLAMPLVLFAFLHGAVFLGDFFLRPGRQFFQAGRDIINLIVIEFLPLPFVLLSLLAYTAIGPGAIFVLGAVPLIVMILYSGLSTARATLERKRQELSVLNEFSRQLRSNLRLPDLLNEIHHQFLQILGYENFYVALYEPEGDRVQYPLVVTNKLREEWDSRRLSDRLTDRVLRGHKPVLIADARNIPVEMFDLPYGQAHPVSWLGVPLIASERSIGCLGVYSVYRGVVFTQSEMDLLTIICGQIGVAIENALLYAQAQLRATQLETLSHLTSLITASLDLQDVLPQICRAVTQVGGSRSAIFLLDQNGGKVTLESSYQLSPEFVAANRSFSVAEDERSRCLRTRRDFLAPDLADLDLNPTISRIFERERIQSFGSFPLTAPEGQLGILTVYFDAPRRFDPAQVDLLHTFASQAAIAVANARRYAHTDMALGRRVYQLSILEAVSRELSAAIHSERLYEIILNFACEFTNSPWGSFGLYHPESRQIEIKAYHGYLNLPKYFPVDQGVSGRAVRERAAVNLPDVSLDLDYHDDSGGSARSMLCIPLIQQEEQVLGILTLEHSERAAYSQADQSFVGQLASQAAIAVMNAHLYGESAQGHERLVALINSVTEGILMIEGGSISVVNDAAALLLGLQRSALAGVPMADLSEQYLRKLGLGSSEVHALLGSLGHKKIRLYPKEVLHIDNPGAGKLLERTIHPVWDNGGRVAGWVLVLRDVTEEHQIYQARELITETLVHDLRSPLSAVIGALDVIEDDIQDSRRNGGISLQAVTVARRGTRRVLDLVDTLLEIARMQAGKLELRLDDVSLPDLVEPLLNDFMVQAIDAGLILRTEISNDLPEVRIDGDKITRVLANLIDNALKFTPSGGQVIVSIKHNQEDAVVMSVSDTGFGIPPPFREKIFDRFVQIPGRRGKRRGSGLGLTFCRLAVEAHGGRIFVEPQLPEGSRFVVLLPLGKESS